MPFKNYFYIAATVIVGGFLYFAITPAGASPGDVIWFSRQLPTQTLTLPQKGLSKQAVLSVWTSVTGNDVDLVECQTGFWPETEVIAPVPPATEPTYRTVPVIKTSCQICDEHTLTNARYAELALAGKLKRGQAGTVVECMEKQFITDGTPLQKFNALSQSLFGRDINEMAVVKIWRVSPTDKTIIHATGKKFMIENAETFRAANEANDVETIVDIVK